MTGTNDRGRRPQRGWSRNAPSQRAKDADPARRVAFDTIQAVSRDDAYANLVLPAAIRRARLDPRDAGLATELTYGTLRGQGTYDAILDRLSDRELDPPVRDLLRLGAHQLLATRIPPHAAVSQTVALARRIVGQGAAGFINANLRRVGERPMSEWLDELTADLSGDEALAVRHFHPVWIVRALRQSLRRNGRDESEIGQLLAANNEPPKVTLVAQPGLISREELLDQVTAAGMQGSPGHLTPWSVILTGGDPASLPAVRARQARVQDEGSQAVAAQLVDSAPVAAGEHWLDLCAGPGGKTALLAALGGDDVTVTAVESVPHRAELIRSGLAADHAGRVEIVVTDGRAVGEAQAATFDRVLVDAPCTGLGALRRRPESRWRRTPSDLAELGPLQRQLMISAAAAVRPGGHVAYATCSPHAAETHVVLDDVVAATGLQVESVTQLWPHVDGTDAMYCALLRRPVGHG